MDKKESCRKKKYISLKKLLKGTEKQESEGGVKQVCNFRWSQL